MLGWIYSRNFDIVKTFQGNVFVHEWSKLRYGVFEEYGYAGDNVYPLFVFKNAAGEGGEGVTKLVPNFCTNQELQGHRE